MVKGRGRRAIPADDKGKEKVSFLSVSGTMNRKCGHMELTTHPHHLLSFPWGVQRRLLCSHVAPKWGDLVFWRGSAQCVHSQPCLFLLCTKSILYFCIWSLEESSSPRNPAVEANLPAMLDPSQFREWTNFQPNYPKDPHVQTSCSFSSGTRMEIMDFARTSSIYKCNCFEVSNISLRGPREKPLSILLMGWAQLSVTSSPKKTLKIYKILQLQCALWYLYESKSSACLNHESCSGHCSEVFL